jgi:IS5 family transposase
MDVYPITNETREYADSGYQWIQEIHEESEYPYKKPRNRELTQDEKEYNAALSRIRVKVENVLGDIKVFRIMSARYRNKRRRFNEKLRIIAGLVNLRNGFWFA